MCRLAEYLLGSCLTSLLVCLFHRFVTTSLSASATAAGEEQTAVFGKNVTHKVCYELGLKHVLPLRSLVCILSSVCCKGVYEFLILAGSQLVSFHSSGVVAWKGG